MNSMSILNSVSTIFVPIHREGYRFVGIFAAVTLLLFWFGLTPLAWIAVLRRMDLSYAYPFLALNFVLIAWVSRVVLGEEIPWIRWAGIGAICIGILLIANGGGSQ